MRPLCNAFPELPYIIFTFSLLFFFYVSCVFCVFYSQENKGIHLFTNRNLQFGAISW